MKYLHIKICELYFHQYKQMITQCSECVKTGKKDRFCNNCIKVADYFDIYKYIDNVNNDELVGRVKAYRWRDALDFITSSFFKDESNLVTNCEKDFAFIEKRDFRDSKLLGYKLYLNASSSSAYEGSLWDLTKDHNTS